MTDILKEIIEKRKADIARLGFDFGYNIPKMRNRKVHPFVQKDGVILEIKRASPSKGNISPNLDATEAARIYVQAGARAISCLTETNYFKGTLGDLMNVCNTVDKMEVNVAPATEMPAVLRKDFLLSEEEVEVSFRAGADAVLLIARILSKDTIYKMARKATQLGISVLIEVRTDDDLEKLEYVSSRVDNTKILCGVNSRDLKDFSIDLLVPVMMLKKIHDILPCARVTFESGILSTNAAAFVKSMGFNAILLGEAAAKNLDTAKNFTFEFENNSINKNGYAWKEYANALLIKKSSLKNKEHFKNTVHIPFVKICGITCAEDAIKATELGADFLGFVMWSKSKRNVCIKKIIEIKSALLKYCTELQIAIPKFVGVIADTTSQETQNAFSLVHESVFDFVQLHTFEVAQKIVQDKSLAFLPHYCAVNISSLDDIQKISCLQFFGEPRILVDAMTENQIGGTGKMIDENLLEVVSKKNKLWIAGGINEKNVAHIIKKFNPEFIDISSSIESAPGKKDFIKMESFFKTLHEL